METKNRSDPSTTFTFKVDNVKVCTKVPHLTNADKVLRNAADIKSKLEDFSHRADKEECYVQGYLPGFISALHTAYDSHYPLKLSVSDFIILIGQGLGRHIDKNAEKLRKHFVNHEGKELIEILRNEFVMGEQNDWSTVFGEFAGEIKKRVKTDIYDVVIDDTSVATPTSRIVSEVALMDCMKNYFSYRVLTDCGIPKITLEGSRDDWEKLRAKVKKLNEMNKGDCLELGWWLTKLIPIVDKICDTVVKKVVDPKFWSGIYKYRNPGSGTPEISGWILTFYPYLVSKVNKRFSTVDTDEIPKQICEVPFVWLYHGTEISMNFYGGFLGAKFNKKDFTIQPAHFWCVAYGSSP